MVHNVQPRLHNGRLLFIAIGCSVLAAIAATYLSFTFLSLGKFPYMWSSVEPFYFGSAISTLLICPFFWQIYLRHKTEASSLGGCAIGITVSLIAHPLTWLFVIIWMAFGGNSIFGHLETRDLASALFSLYSLTLYGLVFVGWITTIVGGVVGHYVGRMLAAWAN